MKVNDITPCGTEIHSVYLDKTEKDNTKWLELITEALKTAKGKDKDSSEEKKPGRKEKEDGEKSEKTIANRESMN